MPASPSSSTARRRDAAGTAARRTLAIWATALVGIVVIGFGAAWLLQSQNAAAGATILRLVTVAAALVWATAGLFRVAEPAGAWQPTVAHAAVLLGGATVAEGVARAGFTASVGTGLAIQAATAAASAWWVWRVFRAAPRWRSQATGLAAAVASAAVVWFLTRHGWHVVATGLAGVTGMAAGCVVGLAGLRWMLSGAAGIPGVARTVLDEAVRMRVSVALLVLLVVMVPTLPLLLDHTERLAYRVQFFLNWALGGTGLILSLLTIFLACGSVCGDIDSGRIHMTLAKPLDRWEYLAGKWLGIVAFNFLMVALAGAGTYTFVKVLGRTLAADEADRSAVDRQVLTARAEVQPTHDRPEEYDAAIDAAIHQLEKDEPDAFRRNPPAARRRIRREYDWQWHTVTPDMVSTFVFSGLPRGGEGVQLQLKPRANNVDIDLADVRFVLWINDRPWPVTDGRHVEQSLPSQAVTTLEIPADEVGESGTIRLTVANRNLVPAGETRPTAITFSPGDGMKVLHRVGGFDGNFVRCLLVIWFKLAMVAAAAVAAATFLGFPTAVLLAMVVYFAALGSGFLRDALGEYNIVADSALGSVVERISAAARFVGQFRLYEAWRMVLGFVTDAVLWTVPAFSDYDAVGRLATGIAVPTGTVLACLLKIGVVYPLIIGLLGWMVFDRRDLIRSST
jgi:hypothetical protein